ncbi:MAG: hypothetical protein M1822_009920 [Bathelium mastoideum]|nr:MAG: hypothetical protein M1822_009920 [Bathelium mastoideum]
MQYVRSISGSVSKTWNSINPATLSGAIDVIVVEQEDGTLACSPFHVRFGKFSLLRPSEKKVEFRVNNVKQEYAMKLGDGGEAFFVFETSQAIPADLQTSPPVSPDASPQARPLPESLPEPAFAEPEPLDLASGNGSPAKSIKALSGETNPRLRRQSQSELGGLSALSSSAALLAQSTPADWTSRLTLPTRLERASTDNLMSPAKSGLDESLDGLRIDQAARERRSVTSTQGVRAGSASPPTLPTNAAVTRAINLSKKLQGSNIPTQVTDEGDLMLDMTGYKSSEDEALRTEVIARKILHEELEGNYDIGALIGVDEKGNLWIYSSEEAKDAAARRVTPSINSLHPAPIVASDAISDPGYQSDDNRSVDDSDTSGEHHRRDSDSAVSLSTPPGTASDLASGEPAKNYAKTLRLTSEQLKALNLKPGINSMSFCVNRATCQANMYYWKHDVPIVISDIDGTITKSDVLGHVLNTFGRDWTHTGVAKLYTDIVANGYNIFYLTSRSVGQADTTRAYLNGILQEGYRLPKGPVILSPDRTIAALRREIYLRKPEVFKMQCLRDIASLFGEGRCPFYAGFGNRLTDALSYRSVNIPSTRIFTINSNAEVSLHLALTTYKTGYVTMRDVLDHFFPPVGLLVQNGGEQFTDFNYWRDQPLPHDEFSASESEEEDVNDAGQVIQTRRRIQSEDEGSDFDESLKESYFSRESIDENGELGDSMIESTTGDGITVFSPQEEDIAPEAGDESDDEENEDDAESRLEATADMSSLHPEEQRSRNAEADDVRGHLKECVSPINSPEDIFSAS